MYNVLVTSCCKSLHVYQDAAVLTLEMEQRSDPHLVAAAIGQLVTEEGGVAAVQACLVLDRNLRERYAKVGHAC